MAKGDIFLKLTSKRAGAIKGEAKDSTHNDEIDVLGWSWSMDFPTDLRTGGRTGRASLRALVVTKACDISSTAIMTVANTNEEISQAVLSVRKSGGGAIDYMTLTLKEASVSAYEIAWHDMPIPQMIERFEMRFKSIEVKYSPQSDSGQKGGATVFVGQVTESI